MSTDWDQCEKSSPSHWPQGCARASSGSEGVALVGVQTAVRSGSGCRLAGFRPVLHTPAGRGGVSGRRSRRCCPPARWLCRTPRVTSECGPAGAGRHGSHGRRDTGQPVLETVDGHQCYLRVVKLGDRDGPVALAEDYRDDEQIHLVDEAWLMNVMVWSSPTPKAHPPRSNPFLRSSTTRMLCPVFALGRGRTLITADCLLQRLTHRNPAPKLEW
jgi:hypothetical protein